MKKKTDSDSAATYSPDEPLDVLFYWWVVNVCFPWFENIIDRCSFRYILEEEAVTQNEQFQKWV